MKCLERCSPVVSTAIIAALPTACGPAPDGFESLCASLKWRNSQ